MGILTVRDHYRRVRLGSYEQGSRWSDWCLRVLTETIYPEGLTGISSVQGLSALRANGTLGSEGCMKSIPQLINY